MPNCSKCRPCMPCVDCIGSAMSELMHGCDGPLTDFVIISRGCELLEKGKFSAEIVANAITEALQELGFLPTNNPILETES